MLGAFVMILIIFPHRPVAKHIFDLDFCIHFYLEWAFNSTVAVKVLGMYGCKMYEPKNSALCIM